MTDDASEPTPRGWGSPRLILFRFAFFYVILYALPFPFRDVLSHLNGILAAFGIQSSDSGWGFIATGFEWIGAYGRGWDAWTSWFGARDWVGVDVIHQRTGSGDTAHNALKLGLSTTLALLLALLWSLIDRWSTNYRTLGKWFHLYARWYLAFVVIGYGTVKLYSGQFPYPRLSGMLDPIGDKSPMGLLWTFMSASKPYEVFSGLGELIGGVLLFWRRTSLLGALVTIAVMTNIVMLNWMYDVPVKLYSTNLLLIAVGLLLPDAHRILAFLANRPVPVADLTLTRITWLRRALVVLGILWVGLHFYRAHGQHMQRLESTRTPRPELYGVWQVEEMTRDGKAVPTTDVARWKLLAIDVRHRAFVRTIDDRAIFLRFVEDVAGKTVAVALAGSTEEATQSGDSADTSTWTFVRGERVVKRLHPAPRRMAEWSQEIEVPRQSLVLRGPWQGAELELHLVRKEFNLERGFHFIQELPYNR